MNRSIFNEFSNNIKNKSSVSSSFRTVSVNFGPQHPAAHGVLRLVLQLNGEIIEKADPHIGLLHRGTEKLMEDRIYLHSIPYFDRLDYVSMLVQEHAYCLAIESLMGRNNYSSATSQVRTLFDELTRILNHLLAIACHALDVGSMSPIFWAFEEREKIMEFYERVSGARMHAAFYRPNDTDLSHISEDFLGDVAVFSKNCAKTLNEMHNVLTGNKVWKQRLVGVGTYSYDTCLEFGLTGVMARCTGLKRDIRLDSSETYANYYYTNFRGFVGQHGDSYDRFLIRMFEMTESLNIINQVVNVMLKPSIKGNTAANSRGRLKKQTRPMMAHEILKFVNPNKKNTSNFKNNYNTMESVIDHFKFWSEGQDIQAGWTYRCVESPKGEFGVSLISDGTNKPFRCKIRSPAYHHLQVLPKLCKGHVLADLVTLIGTIDIVFGEIDR